jgi:hypothetical protein
LKKINEVNALIVKFFLLFEEVDKVVKVPKVVKFLLQKFQEVISYELLDELPFTYDI